MPYIDIELKRFDDGRVLAMSSYAYPGRQVYPDSFSARFVNLEQFVNLAILSTDNLKEISGSRAFGHSFGLSLFDGRREESAKRHIIYELSKDQRKNFDIIEAYLVDTFGEDRSTWFDELVAIAESAESLVADFDNKPKMSVDELLFGE
jgi:hypothetical protein